MITTKPMFGFVVTFMLSIVVMNTMKCRPSEILSMGRNSTTRTTKLGRKSVVANCRKCRVSLKGSLCMCSCLGRLGRKSAVGLAIGHSKGGVSVSCGSSAGIECLLNYGFGKSSASTVAIRSMVSKVPLRRTKVRRKSIVVSVGKIGVAGTTSCRGCVRRGPLARGSMGVACSESKRRCSVAIAPGRCHATRSKFACGVCSRGTGKLGMIGCNTMRMGCVMHAAVLDLGRLIDKGLKVGSLDNPIKIISTVKAACRRDGDRKAVVL